MDKIFRMGILGLGIIFKIISDCNESGKIDKKRRKCWTYGS